MLLCMIIVRAREADEKQYSKREILSLRENRRTIEMAVSSQQLSSRILMNWREEVGFRSEQ